jgi:hypothetical protein
MESGKMLAAVVFVLPNDHNLPLGAYKLVNSWYLIIHTYAWE